MYKRLNRIFAEWKDGVEKCQEWSEGNKSAKIREDDDDDDDDDEDLYEMLNEYKADNKKLKEIRNVLQRECKQLKERIELLIEDKKERS